MAEGFLGRWSRRKLDVKEGRPVQAEPPAPEPALSPEALPAQANAPAGPMGPAPQAAVPAEPLPPPTLDDVAALTPQSDFSRFTGAGVSPEVRNAAMKKLFSDPHFNVMDGLDVYIDDYSLPDPMPEQMLRSLASSEFLGLFREEKRTDEGETGGKPAEIKAAPQSDAQSQPAAPSVAVSGADERRAVPEPPAPDVDPDLRLQQDHAPGPQGPGQGDR